MKDYIEKARRTSNVTKADAVQHARFVLRTELGELMDVFRKHNFYGKPLDLVNLKEEIGDLYWGIAELSYGMDKQALPLEARKKLIVTITLDFILDMLEQSIANGFKQDIPASMTIVDVCYYLDNLCYRYGWTRDEVLAENIAKLEKRYPEGWSAKDYDERKDKE